MQNAGNIIWPIVTGMQIFSEWRHKFPTLTFFLPDCMTTQFQQSWLRLGKYHPGKISLVINSRETLERVIETYKIKSTEILVI